MAGSVEKPASTRLIFSSVVEADTGKRLGGPANYAIKQACESCSGVETTSSGNIRSYRKLAEFR